MVKKRTSKHENGSGKKRPGRGANRDSTRPALPPGPVDRRAIWRILTWLLEHNETQRKLLHSALEIVTGVPNEQRDS